MNLVFCGSCGLQLDEPGNLPPEQRAHCSDCGSLDRKEAVSLSGNMPAMSGGLGPAPTSLSGNQPPPHSKLKSRSRHEGDGWGKAFQETITGSEYSQSLGRYVRKERIIDRENDRYRERVVDPETGEVLHEADEPLSEHQGYGSDKRRPG